MRFQKTEIAQVLEGVSMAPSHLSKVLKNPDIRAGFEAEFSLSDSFYTAMFRDMRKGLPEKIPNTLDDDTIDIFWGSALFKQILIQGMQRYAVIQFEDVSVERGGFKYLNELDGDAPAIERLREATFDIAYDLFAKLYNPVPEDFMDSVDDLQSFKPVIAARKAGEEPTDEDSTNVMFSMSSILLTEILPFINPANFKNLLALSVEATGRGASAEYPKMRIREALTEIMKSKESELRYSIVDTLLYGQKAYDLEANGVSGDDVEWLVSILFDNAVQSATLRMVSKAEKSLFYAIGVYYSKAVVQYLTGTPNEHEYAFKAIGDGYDDEAAKTAAVAGGLRATALNKMNRYVQMFNGTGVFEGMSEEDMIAEVSSSFGTQEKYEAMGRMFESETGYKVVGVSDEYDGTDKRTEGYAGWYIEKDGDGPELISPPLPLPEAITAIKKTLGFIQRYGSTSSKNGFHVSLSYAGKTLEDYDIFKLMLFLGDTYLLELFNRKDNRYAKSQTDEGTFAILDEIHNLIAAAGVENADKVTATLMSDKFRKEKNWFTQTLLDSDSVTDKYRAFNLRTLMKNPANPYIEFRIMGNAGYEDRVSDIVQTVLRYGYVLELAVSPEAETQEYAKKMYKLVNSLKPILQNSPIGHAVMRPLQQMPVFTMSGESHGKPVCILPKPFMKRLLWYFTATLEVMQAISKGGSRLTLDDNDVFRGLAYMLLYFTKRKFKLAPLERDMFRTYLEYAFITRETRVWVLKGGHIKSIAERAYAEMTNLDDHWNQAPAGEALYEQLADEERKSAYFHHLSDPELSITTSEFGVVDAALSKLLFIHELRFVETLNKLIIHLGLDRFRAL